MLLGAHVSVAGGLYQAPIRGTQLGCDSIQIFTKNQRQWRAKPLTGAEAENFKLSLRNSAVKIAMAHDSYLINLASDDGEILEKSIQAFKDEVYRAEALSLPYLVFHPGTNPNAKIGLKRIADSLNWVNDQTAGYRVRELLETTAGQGNVLGYRFEQLSEILEMVSDKERVGVCLDTAHIFGAGYDIRDEESYQDTFEKFDDIIGIKNLFAIHLNDSKAELGRRVDRHDHIGEGRIGLRGFSILARDERFARLPGVLETPGGFDDFRRNLEILKAQEVQDGDQD
jgi:deoxyribonuclease-4